MRKTLVTLALAGLAVVAASAVSAYVLLTPARTLEAPLAITVDDNGLAGVTDFDGGATAGASALNSFEGWNGGGAGIILRAEVGDVGTHTVGDGLSTVFYDDPLGVCTGSCIAATFTGYYSSRPDGSYRIDEADIVFNTSKPWTSAGEDPVPSGSCSGEVYVESMLVHEVGHALGLAHTSVAGATMYPAVSSCNYDPVSIEADDKAALVALYGAAPCIDCERYEQYLAAWNSSVLDGSFTAGAGTLRGWLSGTSGTDFNLYLYRWNGSSWVMAASSTGAGSDEEVAYVTSGGTFLWYIMSAGADGRFFFYQTVP